jgi:predicted ABC-type ATPase
MPEKVVGVKSYKRTTKTGKVIDVQAYHQKRNLNSDLLRLPGRPQVAAQAGSYGAGRSVPNQGVPQATAKAKPAPPPTKKELNDAKSTAERAGFKVQAPLTGKTKSAVEKLQQAGHKVTPDKEKAKAKIERVKKAAEAAKKRPTAAKSVTKTDLKKSVGRAPHELTDADFEKRQKDLQDTIARLSAEGKSTDALHTVDPSRQVWTDERAKLHRQIVDDILKQHAHVPKDHKAVMAGGLGGAGKTTVLTKFAGIDTSQYLTLNPDEIKEELVNRGLAPKAEGYSPMEMSALLHEESSHVTKMLAAIAQDEGINVMWDITMSGATRKTQAKIKDLKDKGYSVDGVFVDIPVETSVERAMARYRRGLEQFLEGKGNGGRYVPPAIIRENVSKTHSSTNREAFETVVNEFSDWSIYDNSVHGRDPQLVDDKKRRTPRKSGSQGQLEGKAGSKTSAAASDKIGLAVQRLRDLVALTS